MTGLAKPSLFTPLPQTYHRGEGEAVGRKVAAKDIIKGHASCSRIGDNINNGRDTLGKMWRVAVRMEEEDDYSFDSEIGETGLRTTRNRYNTPIFS